MRLLRVLAADWPCPSIPTVRSVRKAALQENIGLVHFNMILPMKSPLLIWLMRVLAVAAEGVSLYLLIVSWMHAGLPAGCGAGSGCAQVLSSRWGGAFGLPVSGPAALVYVVCLIATMYVGDGQPEERRRMAWSVLIALAVMIATAALWFIFLQLFVIKAICPWCMTDHILGLMFSVATLWSSPMGRGERAREQPGFLSMKRSEAFGPIIAGVLAVSVLIAGQFIVEYKPVKVQRLAAGANADTGPGAKRTLELYDGRLQLSPHEQAMLGSPDAPHLLVVLFDYCCPHCQATHGYLLDVMKRHPDQLALIIMPMPMDGTCNPTVEETEPRFKHSCELAHLALAVWKARPEAFAEFDRWLFDSDMPREPEAARLKADNLAGAAAIEHALADRWVDRQIALGIQAYGMSNAARIPVIMGAGLSTIVGEPQSAAELMKLLEDELRLPLVQR